MEHKMRRTIFILIIAFSGVQEGLSEHVLGATMAITTLITILAAESALLELVLQTNIADDALAVISEQNTRLLMYRVQAAKLREVPPVNNIKVPKVDVPLLRQQRDFLLDLDNTKVSVVLTIPSKEADLIDGLVNMLDEMLDIAEGY